MVFFNYTTMQVSAKIVYYGPGLCGKTTNLQQIHGKTDPGSRGEMVSLETEADRTLFFDLLPLEVGTIGGMRVRLQLYTVPGQVFYNTTRKLVLKGVDGIVFVADSQVPALDGNIESFTNLRKNLEELNQSFERIPFVFQFNKRDLGNIHSVEVLNQSLNAAGYDVYEAAALHGVGVFETLKAISKKTLAAVHRKISGQDSRPSRVTAPDQSSPAAPSGASGSPLGQPVPLAESAPPPGSAEVSPGTAEVKVEFAAGPNATPSSMRADQARPVRPIATKSRLDVEKELQELRRMALGKASPRKGRKKRIASDRPIQEVAPDEETEEHIHQRIPRAVLESAEHLALELKLGGQGSYHALPGPCRVPLPRHRPGGKTRLRITIDLEDET
ncbi:MAG: hypothetical protein ACE5JI_18070 [Acidobacteriota bacterium]